MADNLLNWARIQMQDINIQRSKINVEEVLQPIIALYQRYSHEKEIQFSSNFKGPNYSYMLILIN